MIWRQFLEIAYPSDLAIEESRKNIIYRSYRWMGLRFAYLFYHLRIPANLISMGRMFISVTSFYFLSLVLENNIWLPFLGAFLLFGQNILDYADGAVARASGKISKLGAALDGIVNAFSRGAILILFGALTGNMLFSIASVFSLFILIDFRANIGNRLSNGIVFKAVGWMYRISLSIEAMLFILPLLIAVSNFLGWSILTLSCIITIFYAGLAILWILICFWKKNE